MPMWLARVIVVLLYLAGFAFMIAMGIYLKGMFPIWFEAYGTWTVFGVMAAGALVLGLGTNLIEKVLERRNL